MATQTDRGGMVFVLDVAGGREQQITPYWIGGGSMGQCDNSVTMSVPALVCTDRPRDQKRSGMTSRGGRAAVAVVWGSLALTGCGATTPEEPCFTQVTGAALTPEELELDRLYDGMIVQASFTDACDDPIKLSPSAVTWSSADPSIATVAQVAGSIDTKAFVKSVSFGTTTVSVEARGARGDMTVHVVKPATQASNFTVLGSGVTAAEENSDLWVHGDYAYTGTLTPCAEASCLGVEGWLYVWHLSGDGGITKVDSLGLPAPGVNDIKVSADGSFAVASQERGADGNGIVILGLADPAHPTVLTRYTHNLENGVHNTWIEAIGGRDYVFAVEDTKDAAGTSALRILDVTDRSAPVEVSQFYGGSSFVHDVYVRDGLAFVSHFDAGLVILDVGNGMAGGSPDHPVEVSRLVTAGGHTHNAWYWPARGLVFVGEERFPPPDHADEIGVVHVVDVGHLSQPREVATLRIPGSSPHNFWVDEDRQILFAAWYTNGLRAIDVSGQLSGDLSGQGRELGYVIPSGPHGAASVWAPQIQGGLIYLSDIFNGIWCVRFDG